jgi:phosphoribosylformylglycinamidine synthase
MSGKIIHYYRRTEPSHSLLPSAHEELKSLGLNQDSEKISSVETESCFNVGLTKDLSAVESERLEWLLAETFQPENLHLEKSSLEAMQENAWQVEFGPRLSFTSAFSSNAVSICQACGISVDRLELSRRYRFNLKGSLSDGAIAALRSLLHDRMTEEEYKEPLNTFENGAQPESVKTIPIMKEGRKALEKINAERGLGFDDFDLDYYTNLFKVRVLDKSGCFRCIFFEFLIVLFWWLFC